MTDEPVERAPSTRALDHALALIDRSLGIFQARELVSADEVADLLLDLRLLLASVDLDERVGAPG